jgi:two-component system, OmpR family, phosphate regulon sensor histidine kinase PhoR
MNSIPNNDLSLYQLIKNSNPSPLSIKISPQALKFYLETITDVLIEQQVKATILLKSPQSQNWSYIIKKCQEKASLESIYLCGDYADSASKQLADATFGNAQTIPLILAKNYHLKRECFFLVLASEFCALVLSQWQKGQIQVDSFGKRLQQPYLETIISFESVLIEQFFTEITKAIAANNPDLNLITPSFKRKLLKDQPNLQTKLLTNLLLKQIIKEDSLNTSPSQRLAKDLEPETPSLATALGLQPDFLRNLIEELRSPITYMKTTISLLESKQIKGEQRQRYLQMLEKQCDRQNSVISGLLELLQLDIATEVDHIYLNDFVPGIVSTYQPLANENNIQLGYTIPANLPPVIVPPSWLRQIIIQLLNNSLQFTPPQGKVFVQAVFKDLNVELTIGDTGRGIDPQELSKIFDSFYRTKTISNDQTTGAGLGLTIVRQLVEKSGGEISVTSKLGKGSSFRILLPALPLELV